MKLQFLGTSAGAPTRLRNVTSLALGYEQRQDWYMFDCGEATQHQLQKASFSIARLSRIFITHLHGDHIFGLPGLLASRSMLGSPRPITVYGPRGIREFIETSLRLSASHLTYDLEITEFTKAGEVFAGEHETISAVRLSHDVPSFAYKIVETDRPGTFDAAAAKAAGVPAGPLFGPLSRGEAIRLENGTTINGRDFIGEARPGRTVIIGGDNDDPSLLSDALQGADLLVHEATLIEAVRENLTFKAHHSSAADVGKTAQKAGLKNLILTHISARFAPAPTEGSYSIEDVRAEALAHYDGKLFIASDLEIYELSRDAELVLVGGF